MNSRVQVALEFGYDRDLIDYALEKYKFSCAGDLIDCLEDLENESEIEDKIAELKDKKQHEAKEREVKEQIAKQERQEKTWLKLRDETERLYARSLCQRCRRNRCNIVCLPCSHLSLCQPCSSFLHNCPSCNEYISQTIKTFVS